MIDHRERISWGIITTLKGPVDQTLHFVNYHLNIGAKHIVLYFDDPQDPAINALNSNSSVSCISCTSEHWKMLSLPDPDLDKKILGNMKHAVPILKEKGIEWAICIDSDELLHAFTEENGKNSSIGNILSLQNKNVGAISVKSFEAVVTKDQYNDRPFRSRWFKVQPKNDRLLTCLSYKIFNRKIIDVTNDGYFFGHTQGKSFFRTDLTFSKCNHHNPRFAEQEVRYIQIAELGLLHYDCMLYDDWRRRWTWRVTGETNSICMGSQRLKQFDILSEIIKNGKDEDLRTIYNKWFYRNPVKLLFLKLFGHVVHININDKMFNS